MHYPSIAAIVRDECAKAGIAYTSHPHLFSILVAFITCLRQLGAAPDAAGPPHAKAAQDGDAAAMARRKPGRAKAA